MNQSKISHYYQGNRKPPVPKQGKSKPPKPDPIQSQGTDGHVPEKLPVVQDNESDSESDSITYENNFEDTYENDFESDSDSESNVKQSNVVQDDIYKKPTTRKEKAGLGPPKESYGAGKKSHNRKSHTGKRKTKKSITKKRRTKKRKFLKKKSQKKVRK